MSEKYAATIKNFLKDNMVGFVFLIIIGFFGFSVWINSQTSTQEATKLINFADQTLPLVRTKFEDISKRSKFDSHTTEQYDQVIADFEELDMLLQNESTKIPTKSNDTASDELEEELRSFFWQTRIEIVSRWIEMLKARKDLIDEYNLAADLKITAESGKVEDLRKVVVAAKTVAEFERENIKMINNINSQKAKTEELQKDVTKLGTIQGILNRTPEGMELSPESRAQIAALYAESGWPLQISIFPQILVEDLETNSFAQNVKSLRELVIELRKKYPETATNTLDE